MNIAVWILEGDNKIKTLVNKANPQIRITAPEIEIEIDSPVVYYSIPGVAVLWDNDWELVEEEPNKVNCPFDKGDCRYCTVQFCGAREEN